MEGDRAGSSNVIVITRKQLFTTMQQQNLCTIGEKLDFLENYLLQLGDFSEEHVHEIKRNFSRFKSEMKRRWIEAFRREELFLRKNAKWLEGIFTIPRPKEAGPGRPYKLFDDSSERSKRRKTVKLRESTDLGLLTYAAMSKLGESGKRDASVVLKDLLSSPKRATKYKKAYARIHKQQAKATATNLTPAQALSIFVEAGLSRRQYEIIRSACKNIFPCYSLLQKAKLQCYPVKESYRVTETCAETNLQCLIDHTVTRLMTHLEEVLKLLNKEEKNTLVLMCKWGCDGAQQAQYKQKFENAKDSDANLFQSSFVPLQLICSNTKKVVWQNPTPSSPRYCRPIRIRFIKESKDITNDEINYIKNAINELQATKVVMADTTYFIKQKFMLTMVDAKVCNAATNTTSTMRCYICGLTSKDFNNLNIKMKSNPEAIDFGLSILHARIRFFETILHLSYKLPIKKWQLRKVAEKEIAKQRKKEIQDRFLLEMGLIVDVPKPGFGNTNDGNTSRRFFADHVLAAEITGINVNLIYRLKVILETLSSGHKINIENFSIYAKDTSELYVKLYPWYPMTPTLHKILVHGSEVIKKALLPIGQLSEEAAEARNKHIRSYRQDFARKFSRISCNMDVLNRLLLSSDPVITGMRPERHHKISKPFLKETLEMLLPAEYNLSEHKFSDEELSDSDISEISLDSI